MTLFLNSVDYSRFIPRYTENLGFAYSSGTFTVQGAQGALSQDNAAYVAIQDKSTPGLQRIYRVVANQTFTDGSAGTTDNQRFGLLTGNVWGANDIPFFMYAVENDLQNAVAFMISRNPAASVSPAAASIGKSGSIVNVGQGDFFSLANITTTDYDANPCTYIGCFRMQFVGATDSWTVTALGAGIDGVGLTFDNYSFNFPAAVQGAATGSFFLANGGTAPIYTVQQETYNVMRSGNINIFFAANANSTAGVGAVTAKFTMPYTMPTVGFPYEGICRFVATGTNTLSTFGMQSDGTAQPYILFWGSGSVGNTTNPVFGANTTFQINMKYQPFIS